MKICSAKLFLFITVLGFSLLACQKKEDAGFEPVLTKDKKYSQADITVDSFSIEQLDKLQTNWTFDAKRAYVFYDKKETHLEKVHVIYYTSPQNYTTITSEKGIFFEEKKQVLLSDHVLIQTNQGRSLRSEELMWDEKQKIIFTDKPVTIEYNNGDTIYGQNGLRANQDLERVELFSGQGIHRSSKKF